LHRAAAIVRARDESAARTIAAEAFDVKTGFRPRHGLVAPPWRRPELVHVERKLAAFAGKPTSAGWRRRWARSKPGVALRGSQLKVTPRRCAKALAIAIGRDGMRCA
jgi:hypothetical protein